MLHIERDKHLDLGFGVGASVGNEVNVSLVQDWLVE